ncbi:MAG: MFS transporter [Roseitalea porphyridii]|uniref:MFS transporter n=1 Tax=Roseitalea porphyridii TaxID=1852022 RepID=UPI0032D9469F
MGDLESVACEIEPLEWTRARSVRNRRRPCAISRQTEDRAIATLFRILSAAGFAATAVSFGPARMGFGLFVPEFRDAFSLSTSTVGFVSSLGFLGFFLGLLAAEALLIRHGPKVPVLAGLSAATVGMAIVAGAPTLAVLATGVFLAGSSAGFAWTPFNDAVHRKVPDAARPAALSAISTGTSVGIALAGIAALAMVQSGLSWRHCWAVFAMVSVVVLIANWTTLRQVDRSPGAGPPARWRQIARRAALPLLLIAFVSGTVSAIYISFAADRVRAVGGLPGVPAAIAPALIFIGYGLFGMTGLATARMKAAIGLSWLLRILMAAGAGSLALVALLPASWTGLTASAGLQGIYVMVTSAVLALWSERLFPQLPSFGFTAALVAMAAGSVGGPAVAGVAADAFGMPAMLMGAAVPPAATAVMLRAAHVRERGADG